MPSDSRTIVFFTTRTSGTHSSWRVLRLLNKHAEMQGLGQRRAIEMAGERNEGRLHAEYNWHDIPKTGLLIQHQVIEVVKAVPERTGLKFLLNFRDPRDFYCNQFFWQDGHRKPGESDEEFAVRLAEIHALGIDKWVLSRLPKKPQDSRHYFSRFFEQASKVPPEDCVMLGYARLCLDYDDWLAKATSAFGLEMTDELVKELEPERADNLKSNPKWIGQTWVGADVLPGRYKRDVTPETIESLNRAYGYILRQMAALDPAYADLYLEGLS